MEFPEYYKIVKVVENKQKENGLRLSFYNIQKYVKLLKIAYNNDNFIYIPEEQCYQCTLKVKEFSELLDIKNPTATSKFLQTLENNGLVTRLPGVKVSAPYVTKIDISYYLK